VSIFNLLKTIFASTAIISRKLKPRE